MCKIKKRISPLKKTLESIPEETHLSALAVSSVLSSSHFHKVFAASRVQPTVFQPCFIPAAYVLYQRYITKVSMLKDDYTEIPCSTLHERLQVFIVAFMIAMKVCDDEVLYPSDLANYLSFTKTEETLTALLKGESAFCEYISWDLNIRKSEYDMVCDIPEQEIISNVIGGRGWKPTNLS